MESNLKSLSERIRPFQPFIAICVLALLIVISWQLFKYNNLQEEIIETGGFTDGKIKCACSEEAWNNLNNNLDLNEVLEDEEGTLFTDR